MVLRNFGPSAHEIWTLPLLPITGSAFGVGCGRLRRGRWLLLRNIHCWTHFEATWTPIEMPHWKHRHTQAVSQYRLTNPEKPRESDRHLGLFLGCSIPAFPKWGAATLQKSTGLGNSRWGNKCGVLGGLWKSDTRYLLSILFIFCYHIHHNFSNENSKGCLHCHSTNIQNNGTDWQGKALELRIQGCSGRLQCCHDLSWSILPQDPPKRETRQTSIFGFWFLLVDHDWALPPPCMVCKGGSVELPSSCSDCSAVAPQQLAAVTLVFLPNLWNKAQTSSN